jgi:excisionase family DNA binding protein
MTSVLDRPYSPTPHDVDMAKSSSRLLARYSGLSVHPSVSITSNDDSDPEVIEIPVPAFELLKAILGQMASGQAFTLMPVDKELSTQQAADILNVSRPYLNKVLDQGEICHRKVGKHRRIKFGELMKYKEKQVRQSKEALDALAEQAQDLDMGY